MADGGALQSSGTPMPASALFSPSPLAPPASMLKGDAPAGPSPTSFSGDGPAQPQTDPKLAELQRSLTDTKEKYEKTLLGAERELNGIPVPSITMPKMPNVQQTTPAQAWGSAAMVLATVGSLFTRQPLTTAMNAMAGVLKGFREADQQTFDNSFKYWQQASQNALALGSFQMQAYHAALEGVAEKLALGEKVSELEQRNAVSKVLATGVAFGDHTLQTILQSEGLPGVTKYFTDMVDNWNNFQKGTAEADQLGRQASAMKEWQEKLTKQGIKITAEMANEHWKEIQSKGNASQFLPEEGSTAAIIGQAIIDGKQPPPNPTSLYGQNAPVRAYLASKGFDVVKASEDWQAQVKFIQSSGNAQQLRQRQNIAMVKEALPLLRSMAEEWNAGPYPPLNSVNLVAAKKGQLGGPHLQSLATKMDAEIADIVSELGTIYKGGNTSTDSSLSLAEQQLQSSWSKETFMDALDLAETNVKYRENSLAVGPAGDPDNPYARQANKPEDKGEQGGTLPAIKGPDGNLYVPQKAPDGKFYIPNPAGGFFEVQP